MAEKLYAEIGAIGADAAQKLFDEKYSAKKRKAYAESRTSFEESGKHLLEAGRDIGRAIYYPIAGPFKAVGKWSECRADDFMGASDLAEILGEPFMGLAYGMGYAVHAPYSLIVSGGKALIGLAQAGKAAIVVPARESGDRKRGEFVVDSDEFYESMDKQDIGAAARDVVGEGFYGPVRELESYSSPRKVKIKMETGSVTPMASEWDGI